MDRKRFLPRDRRLYIPVARRCGQYHPYSRGNDADGLFDQFDAMQIWNRALNCSEVARAAEPNLLVGDGQGLQVFWRADRGYGARIPNLGATGSVYDGVLPWPDRNYCGRGNERYLWKWLCCTPPA